MKIFHTSGLLGKTNITGKKALESKCVFTWNDSLLASLIYDINETDMPLIWMEIKNIVNSWQVTVYLKRFKNIELLNKLWISHEVFILINPLSGVTKKFYKIYISKSVYLSLKSTILSEFPMRDCLIFI